MSHLEGTFRGARDKRIYYQAWLPEGDIKGGILIVHGIGGHSGRFANVVNHLVPQGYAVYGFDLIGHGKSEGKRAFIRCLDDYTNLLTQYLMMVKEWLPNKRIFLLGHSMGGTIACYYLIDHPDDFEGAVISVPTMIVPDYINPITIRVGKLLSVIAPKTGLKCTVDLDGLSRNPKVLQAYIDDPLVFRGRTTARLGAEFLEAIIKINAKMQKINLPLIILQGSEDRIINPQGSQLLFDGVSSKDKDLKIYEGLYHEVFNEPEHEQVLSDVAAWLDEHL
jgi:acylglycerol lipase